MHVCDGVCACVCIHVCQCVLSLWPPNTYSFSSCCFDPWFLVSCPAPHPDDDLCFPKPDQEVVTIPDLGSLSSPLTDTERNLGLLLGLHASCLALSTPLSPVEVECASKDASFATMVCVCALSVSLCGTFFPNAVCHLLAPSPLTQAGPSAPDGYPLASANSGLHSLHQSVCRSSLLSLCFQNGSNRLCSRGACRPARSTIAIMKKRMRTTAAPQVAPLPASPCSATTAGCWATSLRPFCKLLRTTASRITM